MARPLRDSGRFMIGKGNRVLNVALAYGARNTEADQPIGARGVKGDRSRTILVTPVLTGCVDPMGCAPKVRPRDKVVKRKQRNAGCRSPRHCCRVPPVGEAEAGAAGEQPAKE